MNDETLKIIAICKRCFINNQMDYNKVNENIKKFLKDEYLISNQHLLDEYIPRILKKSMYDYIDHCDTPSEILRVIFSELQQNNKTLSEIIPIIFVEQQVCNINRKTLERTYINGFSKRYEEILMELK